MNNRFKFRVWNGVEWCGRININQTVNPNDYENHEDLIFQQFTGLLDANNKEIYEGDIVSFFFFLKDASGKTHSEPIESKALVKYKEDSAEYVLKIFGVEGKGWSFGMLMTFVKMESNDWDANERIKKLKLTVIGNIFENPEFLK